MVNVVARPKICKQAVSSVHDPQASYITRAAAHAVGRSLSFTPAGCG